MNKTKIEWCDYTWNPSTGCLNDCPYCYARKIANRFKGSKAFPKGFFPTFHSDRLTQPFTKAKPSRIFVGSMGDMFGDFISEDTIEQIIAVCRACPKHTYMFLTKNPDRYIEFDFPKNCWLGFSASNTRDYLRRMQFLGEIKTNIIFASIEPIQEEIMFCHTYPNWIIIGAETGNRKNKIIPEIEWTSNMINRLKEGYSDVPIFLKDNLNYPRKIQEFPVGK